ncbi:ABC transporter ATP-binding protein [bacterium]|nr:ABC transporter ATP-binding protein [bacterium]
MAGGAERAAASAGAAAVEVRGVVRRFGDVVALDRVSLAVRPGELFAVLGPSGCGKTTLLRMVAGFEAPDEGTVLVGGEDVTSRPPHRRDVNTVFQQYALFPHLSARDNVAFGPRAHGAGESEVARRVEEALRAVRLEGLGDRRPDELSGGQRQRVAVARALVNRPRALLLDEPLSALDPALRRELQGEIKRLQRESGVAFVLVTHDRQEALALSDRVAVMRGGRVRQVGTPRDVYERPGCAFVAAFVGDANLLPARVEQVDTRGTRVRALGAVVSAGETGTRFAPGDDAVLAVRPEHLRLERAGSGAPGVAVCIEEIAFEGPSLRCLLRTADGRALSALLPAAEGALDGAAIERGASLVATFEPGAARLLPADDEHPADADA